VGASRGGVIITIHQQTLVGELTLHRHDLVLAVISLQGKNMEWEDWGELRMNRTK